MKKIPGFQIIIVALVLAIAPLVSMAAETTFFSDNFTGSSTLNQLPTTPPANGASYQTAIGGASDPSTIAPNRLSIVFTNAASIIGEMFVMFTNTPVAIATNGDHIALTVVFTNTLNVLSGADSGNATLNIGLFYSGGVAPNQGPIVLNAGSLSGGTQGWIGYIARIFSSGNAGMLTRPVQGASVAPSSQNQDLIFSGASSSTSFNNPAGTAIPGGTANETIALTQGATYTMYFSITRSNVYDSTLILTNILYNGAGTGGTMVWMKTNTASGATALTFAFDGMAIGWRNAPNLQASTMDISSIQITGQSSPIPPPVINAQPLPAAIATNGTGAFFVTCSGVALNYQWKRNGTNLLNGGNISGATSPTLVISPAGMADQLSGANGYYVNISNLAGTTNSMTNSLTLRPATNLVWTGNGGNVWDVNSTVSWADTNGNPTVFNCGDSVTFNDSASGRIITLTNTSYLSASSVTMDSTLNYTWQGSGSFAGPGSLIDQNSGQLTINCVNTYTGGTIISNAGAFIYLQNYNGLGNGPVNLVSGANPGIEIVPAGSSSTGINGDINVVDDFTILFDGTGSYTGVFYGNLSGTAGKTLTLSLATGGTTNRFRVYGTNTVFNANLVINGNATPQANYYGSALAPYNSSGSQTYNGIISGNGGLIQRDAGTTILKGTNTYVGGTTPSTGVIAFGTNTVTNVVGAVVSGPIGTGPLYLAPEAPNTTGSGQVMAWGGARTIANPIQYPSSTNNLTLIIGGTNALTFTGPITLNGNDWPNANTYTMRIFQVTNTALTTFSGVISDLTNGVSAVIGLVKSGNTNNSVLALNNTETYTGPTIVSNGTLQVNGSLDPASAVTVSSNATLAGTGTINGPVTINALGTLAPGASIGTITLNGGLTLKGNLLIEVNKSLSPQSNDVATVSGALTNGGTGTLTVTNLGPALAVGDKFKLFNKPLTNGAALTVTGGGTGVIWANNLAVDGSIVVAPSAPPTIITQPTNRAVAQGSSATLSVTASTVTGVTNYLWQMNSNTITASNISGATTNSALTITNFQAGNVGYYRVVINDGNNSTNSNNGRLTLAVSPTIANSGVSGTTLTLQIPTEIGPTYLVQTNSNLATGSWQTAATISGDGTTKPFTTSITGPPQLFIRVKLQ